ncbi:EamA domain-containing membrane protein RarD [Aliiroseovarius halocynthiae]|uniref:DMT family transporter n=1 Tax=Aliiroseovarius halocynthiae TaxID=985055 RepID=A0A545SRB3_9RHOB|nr:DMT family transporter [Aliiroseovarius halocynthiae]TQV67497.1 DMT family transporter [Aliiroseovarius halocynthiae]SMR81507.1 EamA domain-containing membrane protein RarD [Aliiroseovarius halocynthiae]
MEQSHFSGITLRVLSVFLMTAMSAAVHTAAQTVPVGQIMFWRSITALIPITLYVWLIGAFPHGVVPKRLGLHVTRGLFGAFSMFLSFVSLAYLPVANVQAIAYLAPVLTVPLAAFLLKEDPPKSLYIWVTIGFVGVLFVLWDALEAPEERMWIGVSAALGYALTMAFVRVHIKKMTHTESASAIAFSFAIISACVGLSTLLFGWSELNWTEMRWLALAGLLGGAGHIASSEAVARTRVSMLAPYDYTGLIWALTFDFLLFATLPHLMGWAGMIMIIVAAVAVALMPRRL